MEFLDSFMIRSALAGLGVSLAAAPLGCFIVWRRIVYFGDATAHASILGVALALTFSISIVIGVLITSLLMAATVSALSGRGYAMDTLLGVMAHSALAIGLVVASFLSGIRIDLMAYLFGDILAVGKMDIAIIWGGVLAVLLLIWWRWSSLLIATLNTELAWAAGINPDRERIALTVALAVIVAVAIKVVGALLIVAMLIIPPAAARQFSSSPEQMVCLTAIIGVLSTLGGLQLSYSFDTPTGPTMVSLAAIIFIISSFSYLIWRNLVR